MPDAAWHRRQVDALIALGDSPQDAERFVAAAETLGDDDAAIDMAVLQAMSEITDADIGDARADWYANRAIPPAFKRILDAKASDTRGQNAQT